MLISFFLLQNLPPQLPRIIFQCVNTDRLRILSIRVANSRNRYYFSVANQIPSRHPQAVQNLLHTRRDSIHTVPIDVPGVTLSQEIIALYWNPQARQFIFRGVELLSDHAELDWFINAPVRREEAIARRLATRRLNQAARRQAMLERVREVQARLNQVGRANGENHHQPPRAAPLPPAYPGHPQPQPPARRPGFRGANTNIQQSAASSNGSQPVPPASSRAAVSSQQPAPNNLVNRVIHQHHASTPIVRRPAGDPPQPANQREELGDLSVVTIRGLFADQSNLVGAEGPVQPPESVQNANPSIPIVEPSMQAGPSRLQQANNPEVGDLPLARRSVSQMDIDPSTSQATSTAANRSTNSRKRPKRPSASDDSTL